MKQEDSECEQRRAGRFRRAQPIDTAPVYQNDSCLNETLEILRLYLKFDAEQMARDMEIELCEISREFPWESQPVWDGLDQAPSGS